MFLHQETALSAQERADRGGGVLPWQIATRRAGGKIRGREPALLLAPLDFPPNLCVPGIFWNLQPRWNFGGPDV